MSDDVTGAVTPEVDRHTADDTDEHSSRGFDRTFEPGRLNALTDGVVAIAITLLALDLKPGSKNSASSLTLARDLHTQLPTYAAFAIAFWVIAQYWVVHHQLMRQVRHSKPALVVATFFFLFGITLIPLTASINGTYQNDLATSLFAGNVLFVSAAIGVLGEVIRRFHLENYHETRKERVLRQARSLTVVLIPALVLGLIWTIGSDAGYAYILFAVAQWPGRLAWRLIRRSDA